MFRPSIRDASVAALPNMRYFNRSYERGTEVDLIVIESTEALNWTSTT